MPTFAGRLSPGLLLVVALAAGCNPSPPSRPPEVKTPVPAAPAEPPEPWAITYDDLDIGLKPDQDYEPWMMTVNVERMLGRRVRIEGFMSGGVFQRTNIREFPLVKEKDCPFGRGHAHHVTQVVLRGKELIDFTTEPIKLEGKLRLNPVAGATGTVSLYQLDEATVVQ